MIEKAIVFAVNTHVRTKRKGKNRSYVLHPLDIMSIAAGMTDNEEVFG